MFAVAETEVYSPCLVVKELHVLGCGHVLLVECYFIYFCVAVFLCHYSVVCKKGGPSPYGSPSRNPMGHLAGMLFVPTVDTRNLAVISVNSMANCGLC